MILKNKASGVRYTKFNLPLHKDIPGISPSFFQGVRNSRNFLIALAILYFLQSYSL